VVLVCEEETLYITNVLKHTDLKIAFRTNNTLENLLKQRGPIPDKFSSSGVYKLTCPDCQKAYVGRIGRQFYTRYKEHMSAFYLNSRTSNFAQHLQDNGHSFGPIDNIMQVVHPHKKGTHLNTIERFHTHIEHTAGNHLNDEHTIFPNRIFDTLIKPSYPPSHTLTATRPKHSAQSAHKKPGNLRCNSTDLYKFIILVYHSYYYYRYSALGPVWAETRAQSGD